MGRNYFFCEFHVNGRMYNFPYTKALEIIGRIYGSGNKESDFKKDIAFIANKVGCTKNQVKALKESNQWRWSIYKYDDKRQEHIDLFDNVACSGLLICRYNISKYCIETDIFLRNFYFFEALHHFKKSLLIFQNIYSNKELFIFNDHQPEIIAPYRVNNFIDLAKENLSFLRDEVTIQKTLQNDNSIEALFGQLQSRINSWNYI